MCYVPGNNQSVGPYQSLARRTNPFLPICGQRELCSAGVAAIEGPFGLAVADDENAGGDRHQCDLDMNHEAAVRLSKGADIYSPV